MIIFLYFYTKNNCTNKHSYNLNTYRHMDTVKGKVGVGDYISDY